MTAGTKVKPFTGEGSKVFVPTVRVTKLNPRQSFGIIPAFYKPFRQGLNPYDAVSSIILSIFLIIDFLKVSDRTVLSFSSISSRLSTKNVIDQIIENAD